MAAEQHSNNHLDLLPVYLRQYDRADYNGRVLLSMQGCRKSAYGHPGKHDGINSSEIMGMKVLEVKGGSFMACECR